MEENKHSMAGLAAVFVFLFFSVGSFLGSLTLLGPVQYVTGEIRARGFDFRVEKAAVRLIILLLVAVTAWVSYKLTRKYSAAGYRHKGKLLLVFGLTLLAVFAYVFSNPHYLKHFMPPETKVANFVFGPYPDEETLERLKYEGYTGVISLLHPAVVPFEPKLIADEEKNCAKVGITLIGAPMLPWISENVESAKIVERLAADGRGKYYVHCYLGHDRVSIVKAIVQKKGGAAKVDGAVAARRLSDIAAFERGAIVRLTGEIYLTPYPTDDEFVAYLLNGEIKNIVNIMDPGVKEDRIWIEREKAVTKTYSVNFVVHPIAAETTDVEIFKKARAAIEALQGATAVHGFRVDSPREKSLMEAFGVKKSGSGPK